MPGNKDNKEYFESGVTNASFTMSDEYINQNQAMPLNKDLHKIPSNNQGNLSETNLQTKNNEHSFENRILNEKPDKKDVKMLSKNNPAKDKDSFFVSVIDEKGKLRVTEAKKSDKFAVNTPISKDEKPSSTYQNKHLCDPYAKQCVKKVYRSPITFPHKRQTPSCSNHTLNSQSSTVNICELGEDSFSSTSEGDESDDVTSSTNPDNFFGNDSETNTFKQHPSDFDQEVICTPIPDKGRIRSETYQHLRPREQLVRRRMVSKKGHCNISLLNIPRRRKTFAKDIFTTAVDMPWRYTVSCFVSSFFVTWLGFTLIWYLICLLHGDLEVDHLPNSEAQRNGSWIPCISNINNFASCFLFSVETQHTIGYGSRATSEECPHAIIIMCIQSIIGVLGSTCMAGIVFAKLSRPKRRAHTIAFSKNAVICMRNGWLYLLFRVGNLRTKSNIVETHVTAKLVYPRKMTKEGEQISFDQEELKVSTNLYNDEGNDQCFMMLPNTICHKIDENSPFYKQRPKDILRSKFELVVILEGIVETTGNTLQTRTSYLPTEILWGYRFENMVRYVDNPGTYLVDCSYMNAVIEDKSTPYKSMVEILAETK